jgi:hypothetical protein
MKTALKFMATFAAGLLIGGPLVWAVGVGQDHVHEETKMAFINRSKAIERGDRAMQTYFEEVITWNACMYLRPRFFEGSSYKIDWLSTEVEEPPYRRIKDGISYADLRTLMLERAAAADQLSDAVKTD